MTYDQVAAWIEKYVQAWRNNDVAKLADLFAADATYKETPWSDTIQGLPDIQKFWKEVCSNQGDVEVRSTIVAVEGAKAEVHLQVHTKPISLQNGETYGRSLLMMKVCAILIWGGHGRNTSKVKGLIKGTVC